MTASDNGNPEPEFAQQDAGDSPPTQQEENCCAAESACASAQGTGHHRKKLEPKLQKTKLDDAVLREAVARMQAEQEAKAAELAKARANEPVKPFEAIENYKKATPCNAFWNNTDPSQRFRYCEQCHMQVYDFTGLEKPEAEELIWKRENRRNAPLFQRADGKFLTSDCPVGIKRKQNLIMTTVGGVVLVACVLGFLLMVAPQQKHSEAVNTPTDSGLRAPAAGAAAAKPVAAPATGEPANSFGMPAVPGETGAVSSGGAPLNDDQSQFMQGAPMPMPPGNASSLSAPPVGNSLPAAAPDLPSPTAVTSAPSAQPASPSALPASPSALPAPPSALPAAPAAQPVAGNAVNVNDAGQPPPSANQSQPVDQSATKSYVQYYGR